MFEGALHCKVLAGGAPARTRHTTSNSTFELNQAGFEPGPRRLTGAETTVPVAAPENGVGIVILGY